MMKNRDGIAQLIRKYRQVVVMKTNEALFPLDYASGFVEEFSNLGELVIGVSGWRYVNKSNGWIAEIPGADFALEEAFAWTKMSLSETVVRQSKAIADYIESATDNDIEFISFVFNDPSVNDFFLND